MLFFLVLYRAAAQPREPQWIRLAAGNLEILTDAGEGPARAALERLEQVAQAIPAAGPGGPRRLRLYLFAAQRDYQALAPDPATGGFFQSGQEYDAILTFATRGLDRVVVHEYVHFVLREQGSALPQWLQEGLAEFYSTVEISRSRLRFGLPIETHRDLLRRSTWLDAASLRLPPSGPLYYAQSWALAHMLNLDAAYRDGMPRFAQLLTGEGAGRVDDDVLFEQAFGRTMSQALADLRAYVGRLRASEIPAPPLRPVARPPAERLTAADGLLLRAELALRSGRIALATELYQLAARNSPDSSSAALGLGALAAAQGRNEEAGAHLERAIQFDPGNAAAWFEYALLEQDRGAGAARVRELLEKTVAANPDFGEAHALLGIRATDEGRYDDAIAHLEDAARLLPRKSYVWHALAFAQQKRGRTAEALVSARRAARTAATPEQAAMAESLLLGLNGAPR